MAVRGIVREEKNRVMDVGSRKPGERLTVSRFGPLVNGALLDVLGEQTHWGPLLGTTPWSSRPMRAQRRARVPRNAWNSLILSATRLPLGSRSDFKGPIGFASPPYGGFTFVEDVAVTSNSGPRRWKRLFQVLRASATV